jgi:RNA polymerase sigma factor (sigma-70 family)
MADVQLQAVVRQIRRLATGQRPGDQTDGELLHAFRSGRDQPAFTELVRRHAPMVLSVCGRVLHHVQDAEDAFQATFLLLARRADAIRKTESLASWLHGVAYRMATHARKAASRRRKHESRSTPPPPANPAWTAAWQEVQAILDEEIDRLPEIYRQPFVLCCLENRGCAEVARLLGQKEGTVWSRVARARKKLQDRLSRRGVSLSAVLGAAALSGHTALSAVPPALIARTAQAASGPVSPNVAALLKEGNKAMTGTKLRTVILLALAALGVGVAAGVLALREAAARPSELPREAEPPARPVQAPAADAPKPQPSLEEKGEAVTVRGRVLDPEGEPFAGAKLYLWVDGNREKPVPSKVRAMSAADGRFHFTFAKQDIAAVEEPWVNSRTHPWRQAVVVAAAPGYGAGWAGVTAFEKGETLRLVKDDAPVKGRIRDLQGRPVAGAAVEIHHIGTLFRPAWVGLPEQLTTDQDGRFTLTGIGRGRETAVRIASPTAELKFAGFTTGAPDSTVEIIAGPTKPIEGVVRARDTGKPLPGVVVYAKSTDLDNISDDPHGVRAVTDGRGRYRLVGLAKAGKYEVTVYPRNDQSYLSATKWVGDTEGLKPIALNFDLRRGVTVRFRLMDKESGQSVRGFVQYTPARSNPLWAEAVAPYRPSLILPPRVWFRAPATDKDGYIQFVAYPGHGAICAQAGWDGQGYLKARLDPADAKKGYYPLGKGDPNNGFIHITSGYRVIDTDKTDKPLTFDIELTRGRTLQGTLVGPDGKPVIGATAFGLTFDASAEGRTDRDPPLAQEVLKTDAFTALGLYPKEPRTLSFAHAGRKLVGHVVVNGTEAGPLAVRLEPYGTLTGRVVDEAGEPLAGVLLRLHYPELPRPGFLYRDLEYRTDAQGRFRVEWLLPGLGHGLSVAGDAKRQITAAAPETLKNLSAAAGAARDLGDVRVKVTPVKKDK